MGFEDQTLTGRRRWPTRIEIIGLVAVAILWLSIEGHCAIRLLSLPGQTTGAASVMVLPLLAVAGWWWLVARVPARLTDGTERSPTRRRWQLGLLILAMALAAAAVYTGEMYARSACRLAIADVATAQLVKGYRALATAGSLLLLAVATLTVALARLGEPAGRR